MIFYYTEIVKDNLDITNVIGGQFVFCTDTFDVFYDIRGMRDVRKKPSTSELIDWINVLQLGGISADEIRAKLPFVGVIVKKDEDLNVVRSKINMV